MFSLDAYDGGRWDEMVKATSLGEIADWVRELHPDMTDERWIMDSETLPYLSFMDGEHCCGVGLCNPTPWLVLRMCLRNLE